MAARAGSLAQMAKVETALATVDTEAEGDTVAGEEGRAKALEIHKMQETKVAREAQEPSREETLQRRVPEQMEAARERKD